MPVEFECPHCQAQFEQTKKNRMLPRIECEKCGKPFCTQWAEKPEDKALPRGAVVSERFELGRNFCNKLWNALAVFADQSRRLSRRRRRSADERLAARRSLAALAAGDRHAASDRRARALSLRRRGPHAVRLRLERVLQLLRGDDEGAVRGGRSNAASRRSACWPCARCAAAAAASDDAVSHRGGLAVVGAGGAGPRAYAPGSPAAAESVCIADWPVADTARHRCDDRDSSSPTSRPCSARCASCGWGRTFRRASRSSSRVRCDAATAKLLEPMQPYFTQMAKATATGVGPDGDAARSGGQQPGRRRPRADRSPRRREPRSSTSTPRRRGWPSRSSSCAGS